MTIRKLWCVTLAAMMFASIAVSPTVAADAEIDSIAESYVKLILKVGLYNTDYVDYYYGPEEWRIPRTDESREKYPLSDLDREAATLLGSLESIGTPEQMSQRERFLLKQLTAVRAFIKQLQGVKMTFDQESKALYDVVAPHVDYSHYDSLLAQLDSLLPGEGSIGERLKNYRDRFIVPSAHLVAVMELVTNRARQIAQQHLDLPENEILTMEYVTDKPWGGFCTFLGNAHSLVETNVDLPLYAYGAIDGVTHEEYPGHHTNYTMIEKCLVRDSGWIEYTVSPLFTPWAVVAEGIATYAIDMAFPYEQRLAYLRAFLLPIIGLDTAEVDNYLRVTVARNRLSHVDMSIARDYLDGTIDSLAAVGLMKKYSGVSDVEANQSIAFDDTYRSYRVTYSIGYDLVRKYVEAAANGSLDPEARWKAYARLLELPFTPSDLESLRY